LSLDHYRSDPARVDWRSLEDSDLSPLGRKEGKSLLFVATQFDRGLRPPALPSNNAQLAPDIASSVVPVTKILRPSSSAILRLCRQPTSDLHRILHPRRCQQSASTLIVRCVLRSGLPICRRLAPPTDLPALPSNSTSESSRLLHLRPCHPANLRLAPPTDRPALPSNSTPGSHRLLSSPARPSCRPPTCVGDQPSGLAFELNLRTHRLLHPPALRSC